MGVLLVLRLRPLSFLEKNIFRQQSKAISTSLFFFSVLNHDGIQFFDPVATHSFVLTRAHFPRSV